jgi:hypothetical protein
MHLHFMARAKGIVIAAIVSTLSISLPACSIGPHPVTYLAPAPAYVPSLVYPRQAIAYGHTDIQTICFSPTNTIVAPPNKDMASFDAGDARFCYLSPTVSGQKGNPRQLCESTLAPDPIDSPMTFRVFVAGKGIAVDQPTGILTVDGQSTTEAATVQNTQVLARSEGLNYQLPRWDLTFVFKQQCDPSLQYQLAVKGITSNGRPIEFPPVDFNPYTEKFPKGMN